jgi:hypothetical protein
MKIKPISPYCSIIILSILKMLINFFRNLFRNRINSEVILLGRWGYHWDKKKDIQKFYD